MSDSGSIQFGFSFNGGWFVRVISSSNEGGCSSTGSLHALYEFGGTRELTIVQ